IYATLLSILALVLKGRFRSSCSFHASWIFFIQFLIFVWRNILPLTTFTGVPADGTLPWLLWTRGSFVTLVGVALPAFMPRLYIPYDPANPAPNPAPEQTASIFSFLFFFFLEPIIFAAWRIPQLPYDELPPLPDSDWSDNLRARAMDALDPVRRRAMGKKQRHLFWGLMDVFRWDYTKMSCYLLIQCLCRSLGPIGINRLLTFMEHHGTDATIRPWVWILFIFLGPTLKSLIFNMYIFTSTQMMVQAESILTQVIFEHALRVRLTDDAMISASPAPASGTATATRSDEQSTSTPGTLRAETPTLVGTNTSGGGKATTASTAPSSPDDDKGKNRSPGAASTNKAMHLSAKINNLFGTDIGNLIDGRNFLMLLIDIPVEAVLCVCFLWIILSWAAIIGIIFMMITLPLPGMITSRIQAVQRKLMQKTDLRVQAITESLSVIRMIKMFGWEGLVKSQVRAVRTEELHYIRQRKLLRMWMDLLTGLLQMATMIIAFAVYTLVLKQELDAARVFSSIPVFSILRRDMSGVMRWITNIIQAKVSLDRVSDFLHSSHLLDKYHRTPVQDAIVTPLAAESDTVGFHNATFTWSDPNSDGFQPGQRHFRLHIEDLTFKNGKINIIVGPTGCGKTSILMALLGEMHFQAEGIDSWFSLPRVRGIAYAAQESWIQNDTIRSNILFGSPFDEVRYQKGKRPVLYQCGLVPDLAMFTAGDLTEVGERGLTLSGGQKILLLDDVVSALDVHTARWVVEKCLQGDLIKDRTVVLVTHAVALVAPIASNVISLSPQGRLISQGPLSKALLSDPSLEEELEESKQVLHIVGPTSGRPSVTQNKSMEGKLVMKEEMAEGRMKWASIKLFIDVFGGPMYWMWLMLGFAICMALNIGGTWWLGYWAQAYEVQPDGGVNVLYYLFVFVGITILQELVGLLVQVIHTLVSVRACRRIHDALCESVLRSTLRWIDSTPVGRIVSRFTQDIREIDGNLTPGILYFLKITISMMMEFVVVMVVSPVFSIPGAFIVIAGLVLGQIYIAAQMCVKRLRSNWRSPLYNHFAAAITGLISVRAYAAEDNFKTELRKRADAYSRPSRTFYNLNRWISTRADLLGALFSAGLATYLVYARRGIGASTIGLNMAIDFSSRILDWVRTGNDLEVSLNSVERIRDYLTIDHEPEASEGGNPPAYWPASGAIKVESLFAKYSEDGPFVLRNITFDIKSGERVGIVGRTGSGKSSLALSLLRLIPVEGKVYLDGRLTDELNLDALRNNVAIIPQDPTLLSGTLRFNLDPFSQHDDAHLYDALRATGLITDSGGSDGTNLSLDSTVANAGSNFSVGQRQLIALARAVLRGTRVLILDEATASVDAETDSIIQSSIRAELQNVTLITIAHRLLTIMDYDKTMVLDAGKLVEFGTPLSLLQNEKSYFRSLVEESGDKEKLMHVAEKGRTHSSDVK
ncbi:P-loop containing nucleoside triphosphate hydrolase protein, partial [Calocera cornea HHB12733]